MVVNTERESGNTAPSSPADISFPDMQSFWDHLFELKCMGHATEAYADLGKEVTVRGPYLQRWDKDGPMFGPDEVLPKGTTVRIVMVSRMGDVGWTPHLNDAFGYRSRTSMDDNETLTNLRLTR